jgi:membrane-bound lytic murein transglycosylase D
MYDIAQKYGVILQNLYAYNQLTPDDYIVAGTKIFLKPNQQTLNDNSQLAIRNQPSASMLKADGSKLKTQTHEVLPKESLYGISKKYGVTVDELKKWNNLTSDNLKIGQQLIISK